MTNLVCKLIGHKSNQYLQTTETNGIDGWIEEGILPGHRITRRIDTHFLCRRCHMRYKQTETYIKKFEVINVS